MGDDEGAWITPEEALAMFGDQNEADAKGWILALLRDGTVKASSPHMILDGRKLPYALVGNRIFNSVDVSTTGFWDSAWLNEVHQGASYSAYDIRIDSAALRKHQLVPSNKKDSRPSMGGRPPANWWPAFCEELAVYVHDRGIPESQEEMISVLLQRLSDRDIDVGRSTVQPVIRAVFKRLNQARN